MLESTRENKPISVLLYLFTGIATAIPVIWMMMWAVWGAPTSRSEHISLLGSAILLLAAFVSMASHRLAAPIALAGAIAVWSFYLPLLTGVVRVRLSTQDLKVTVFRWTPSPSPLNIQQGRPSPGFPPLSSEEIQQIRDTDITGLLSRDGGIRSGFGEKSHAILIIQKPVSEPVELRQPDATTVVYVQYGQHWKIFPSNARLLKRTIRLEPETYDPSQTSVEVESGTGERESFGISWPEAAVREQPK